MMLWNKASQQNLRCSHLRDFNDAATKRIFDDWSFFKRSKKKKNIQDNKIKHCPKFVTLGTNKVLTFKPSATNPIFSWQIFFLTGTIHNKQKLPLSWTVYWLWCADKFPWKNSIYSFFFSQPSSITHLHCCSQQKHVIHYVDCTLKTLILDQLYHIYTRS